MLPAITNTISNNDFSIIGQPFTELLEINSTNSYAMDMVQANLAAHGAAYFAHHQTAGKGQRGKQWMDEKGSNIILSVVIDASKLIIHQQFNLSVAIALACHRFFCWYAGEETTIKWPNDIYWRDRKAAGILIENSIKGNDWLWAIAGVGMNINQTSFEVAVKNPVSLKQITGKTFEPVNMAKELCSHLNEFYIELVKGNTDKLLEEYNRLLYKKGQNVKLKYGAIVFAGIIENVNSYGQLKVSNAPKEYFDFGELEWVV